jgi:peptidylprolyl isomerase
VIDNIDGISVTGDFGTAANVTANWPFTVDKTMNKVLIQGTGNEVTSSGYFSVWYTGVNARTGQVFDSNYGKTQLVANSSSLITGFGNSMTGKHVGDRVLMVITGADGYDSQGGSTDAGIEKGDTLVFVVDIVQAQFSGPSGEAVTPAEGLPTVADNNGTPTITVPAGAAAPTTLQVQTLTKGSGPAMAAGDGFVANYVGINWATGATVETSYGASPEAGALSSMIAGWQQGLVGQTAGSRVLLVTPPDLAYPNGDTSLNLPAGQTIVWVVDLLFVAPTSSGS